MKKLIFTLLIVAGAFSFAKAQQTSVGTVTDDFIYTDQAKGDTKQPGQQKSLQGKPAMASTADVSGRGVHDDFISTNGGGRKHHKGSCCHGSKKSGKHCSKGSGKKD